MMESNIINSLLITAIGMGLVFLAILLFWGIMTLLVLITSNNSTLSHVKGNEGQDDANQLACQAAIAAVVVTLAQSSDVMPHEFPLPPTALVSAWQAVMRGDMLKKRGQRR